MGTHAIWVPVQFGKIPRTISGHNGISKSQIASHAILLDGSNRLPLLGTTVRLPLQMSIDGTRTPGKHGIPVAPPRHHGKPIKNVWVTPVKSPTRPKRFEALLSRRASRPDRHVTRTDAPNSMSAPPSPPWLTSITAMGSSQPPAAVVIANARAWSGKTNDVDVGTGPAPRGASRGELESLTVLHGASRSAALVGTADPKVDAPTDR